MTFRDIARMRRLPEADGTWRAHSPLRIVDSNYETLVADAAPPVARLRDFLGLASDTQPVSARTRDAITTASVWQARQPVYGSSVGRWQRYAPYLPKLAAFDRN